MTLRRQHVDRCLESVDGVDVWFETIHGAEARQMVDGRLLVEVLRARARVGLRNDPHETRHLKAKPSSPLRVIRDDRKRESA